MSYDSRIDTYEHILKVQEYLHHAINLLHIRALYHDRSKLESPEKDVFDAVAPKLNLMGYGSPEYMASLEELAPALDHHYIRNRHHPQYHPKGITGMNLIDLVEMFCDWMAATHRMSDGDILQSIEINQSRFGYSDELAEIFRNTAATLRSPREYVRERDS